MIIKKRFQMQEIEIRPNSANTEKILLRGPWREPNKPLDSLKVFKPGEY